MEQDPGCSEDDANETESECDEDTLDLLSQAVNLIQRYSAEIDSMNAHLAKRGSDRGCAAK